ncbi:DNA polymerase IV [Bacillus sp. RG28]|uniref:DNA polymerase IV n=1 Tax=Gottfriedia endophytica TaxID=2820819 RepID=A0A940NP78_9BACI|nr:DNA polymerase IV [Gottfriedia endophytica]MBP0724361.1 DNA polymerase IV [Gottfriedia endophytica]
MNSWVPKNGRVILHVDMNAFFASVEIANDPSLKGKPLVIAGNEKERRGIIVTASYEARAYGLKATMPLWEARKKCPNMVVKLPNHELYRKVSRQMFAKLGTITPLVEAASIDEGYLDITDCRDLGHPIEIAKKIQQILLDELGLPCSIGIAPNKFLAKTASDIKKPQGITILRKRDVPLTLWPKKIREMHGVGLKTEEKLNTIGIYTIEDLAKSDINKIQALLGSNGISLKNHANGIDEREVDPSRMLSYRTIGHSSTFSSDVSDEHIIASSFEKLSNRVCDRLRKKGLNAETISITLRFKDRKTITRSMTTQSPIQEGSSIFKEVMKLWKNNWNGEPLRLIGVTTSNLVAHDEVTKQLDLFSYEQDAKQEPLMETIQKLKNKFGEDIIGLGRSKQKINSKNILDVLKTTE